MNLIVSLFVDYLLLLNNFIYIEECLENNMNLKKRFKKEKKSGN